MNLLYLAFANNQESPLASLQEEDDTIYRALTPRALKQDFLLHRESYTTTKKIAEYITLFRTNLAVFHYSGHAGRDQLFLQEEAASSMGIAALLGTCEKLKLVVLNGCSTKGQVEGLLNSGVPVVVATSAPVEDVKAMRFGSRFYKALSDHATIGEAFELAMAEILAIDAGMSEKVTRGLSLRGETPEVPQWGIYYQQENAGMLDEKLPVQSNQQMAKMVKGSFKPNDLLIDSIWEGLKEYNDQIYLLSKKKTLSLARKRMAILNSLPAPVAEHIRKLMVPVKMENEGFDKFTIARLKQIVTSYQSIMELTTFTLLAQLWETFFEKGDLVLSEERKQEISNFLNLKPKEQEVYDYVSMIRLLLDTIDQNEGTYFVEELVDAKKLLLKEGEYQRASFFLEVLKVKLSKDSVAPSEIQELCRRAEISLGAALIQIGFIARYALVAVQSIDVLKFRHTPDPSYNHVAVILRDLLGGLDITELEMDTFMDSKSIIVLNEENETFLNLSPFIIDANAFEPDTDISKIYFVSHYDEAEDTYVFKYIYKPDDKEEWLRVNDDHFPIVKVQFDAFKKLLA